MLDAAHQQLRAPIVLIRDLLSLHRTPAIRSAIAARRPLLAYQLPAYATELNPVEKVWVLRTMVASLNDAKPTRLPRPGRC